MGDLMCKYLADYYTGADGETLLIQLKDLDSLKQLKGMFNELAQQGQAEITLSKVIDIKITDFTDMVMSNRYTYVDIRKKDGIIMWGQTSDDWVNCAGLIDGLIECAVAGTGGHQYLGDDRIAIVLSYNEHLGACPK